MHKMFTYRYSYTLMGWKNESKFPASITISYVMILEHIVMDKSSTEFTTWWLKLLTPMFSCMKKGAI